ERLENHDQQFQEVKGYGADNHHDAKSGTKDTIRLCDQIIRTGTCQHDDHVASQHGCHQTQGVGQWTNNEVRYNVKEYKQWKNPARHTLRHNGKFEVLHTVVTKTYTDPDDVHDDRYRIRRTRM